MHVCHHTHAEASGQAPSYLSPAGAWVCWKDTLAVPYALIEISSTDLTGTDGWRCHYVRGPGEEDMGLEEWYKTMRYITKVKRLIWLFGL